jgi:hypothetical protein
LAVAVEAPVVTSMVMAAEVQVAQAVIAPQLLARPLEEAHLLKQFFL